MDKAIARHSIRTAFQLGRMLSDYLEFAKTHTDPSEFEIVKIGVAEAIDKINTTLINIPVSEFPELADEIDFLLEKYGKYL